MATLELHYGFSPSLIPGISRMSVFLNNTNSTLEDIHAG